MPWSPSPARCLIFGYPHVAATIAGGRGPKNPDSCQGFELFDLTDYLAMVGHDCGPNGAVATWRDLLSAAVVVRSMLGVSPSAYERPAEFLERRMQPPSWRVFSKGQGHIYSAGGY